MMICHCGAELVRVGNLLMCKSCGKEFLLVKDDENIFG